MKSVNIGRDVDASDLRVAINNSSVMQKKGYSILYDTHYPASQEGGPGYGLCFERDVDTYIHIRLSVGRVASFDYFATLDTKSDADQDMQELRKELQSNSNL